MAARLKEHYKKTVAPALMKEFGYANLMAVPKLEKIVVNVGVGDSQTEPRLMEEAMEVLAQITGQKGSIRTARRSIAGFKVREGAKIGCMATLRGDRMYEFLDRLINISLPRVRDFRGVSQKAFDGRGNYTLGLREQLIFPEVDYDKIDKIRGMEVTIVTTAPTDEEGLRLLALMGMPFRREVAEAA